MSAIHDTMIEPPNFAYDWYTPLTAKDVKQGKITPFAFMGHNLIAFRNNENKVVVMDGVCPHFGADMAKGDIVDGQARCYFHGFYFDSNGNCTKGDVVKDPSTLEKIKIGTWAVEECAEQIWIWHGKDQMNPDRPLPIKDLNWDEWSTPITSKERTISNSNMCYLTENIIDMQHFDTVHKWKLHELVGGPLVDDEGLFCTDIKVGITMGAQSENAVAKFIGKLIKMNTRIRFKVYSPGCAIATSNPGDEIDESKSGRNIVCIYPINEKDVSIRVAVCFKKKENPSLLGKMVNAPLIWFAGQVTSKIAVADFDGDLKVWNNRQYLTNPRYVKEDGPMILFRKWYLRFWHQDYAHELTDTSTVGNKIESIRVAQA